MLNPIQPSQYNFWSLIEVDRLKKLWSTEEDYIKLHNQFPDRTPTAIRVKASRLRLFRPNLTDLIQKTGFLVDCTATEYLLNYLEDSY